MVHLILNWIKVETYTPARGAGSQKFCQWTVRSWILGDPSARNTNKRSGALKKDKRKIYVKLIFGEALEDY